MIEISLTDPPYPALSFSSLQGRSITPCVRHQSSLDNESKVRWKYMQISIGNIRFRSNCLNWMNVVSDWTNSLILTVYKLMQISEIGGRETRQGIINKPYCCFPKKSKLGFILTLECHGLSYIEYSLPSFHDHPSWIKVLPKYFHIEKLLTWNQNDWKTLMLTYFFSIIQIHG